MINPQSALIAVVPEAEPLVGAFRRQFDPSEALGVPAHITVLYPFRAPDMLDGLALTQLRRCFGSLTPIEFKLTELHRFGQQTLYLAPDPGEPFRQLTMAAWQLFPDTPPYGGQWPDIVPHLSVAHAGAGTDLDAVALEIGRKLDRHPVIAARIREITLMENITGRWSLRATFPLGP